MEQFQNTRIRMIAQAVKTDSRLTRIDNSFLVPKLLLGNAIGTKALLWTTINEDAL